MFKTTKATTADEYISMFPKEDQAQLKTLDALIKKTVPNSNPVIISGMLGYALFHYTSKSGRAGDWPLIALARQKNYFSLYICASDSKAYLAENHKAELGKVDVGKSCIRFKTISDLNLTALENVLKLAVKAGGFNAS